MNGPMDNYKPIMTPRNILMLCYYFPPLTDVGGKRSVAFSKYFIKYGWKPYVLSVKNPDKAYCSIGYDQPPSDVHTEYTYSIINLYWIVNNADAVLRRLLKPFGVDLKVNYFYNLFCFPDHFWGWIPHTAIRGVSLIKKYKIDFIYVSCTPHSSAITGIILKKLTGKPLIIDYRDPYHVTAYGISGLREKVSRSMQAYFLRHADIVVVNNEETKRIYLEEYPQVKGKIFAVHNGFDAKYLPTERLTKYEKFTIVYTGDFYFQLIPPDLLFKAISLLVENEKIDSNSFQFLFYGDGVYEVEKLSKKYGIEELVNANGRIPYKEVLNIVSRSHLQLLRIAKPMISTKFFEGIPLNVPFLATIPPGEVDALIKEYSPSSLVITNDSSIDVADAIMSAISMYENNQIQCNHIQEFLDKYSRENLTLDLMSIIENNLSSDG